MLRVGRLTDYDAAVLAKPLQRVHQWLDQVWPTAVSVQRSAHDDWQPDEADEYCHRCGASAGPGSVLADGCAFCRGQRLYWDRVTRLSFYDAPMDGWIKQMKFAKQWSWAPHLGRMLAERVGDPIQADRVVVTYVPMHWRRRWRRGFNQAELMAQALAKARGWPMVPMLLRTSWTPPQPSVIPSQREVNVRQSFALHAVDLSGWQVLLVDDIKTSGATLGACSRLLNEAGARSIQVAVAAVADPKGMGFQRKV